MIPIALRWMVRLNGTALAIRLSLAILMGGCLLPGHAEANTADSRKAWRYSGTGGTNTFVNVEAKKWIVYRGDGLSFLYIEEGRTPNHIELRGPTTKIWFRLGDGQALMRKSSNEPWRRWAVGKWVDRGSLNTYDRFGAPDRLIRLIYFVPADRQPVADYAKRIGVLMSMAAEVLNKDLLTKGHRRAAIRFEANDEAAMVHLIRGREPAAFYNDAPRHDPAEQFARIGRALRETRVDPERHLVVVFAETYEEGPAIEAWKGHIARGIGHPPHGGLAVYSAWVLKDEFCALTVAEQRKRFFDAAPVPGRKAFGASRGDSPRFEFVEDGVGAALHELGHALGLPHDYRDPDDVMGNGFRNLRWNFSTSPRGRPARFSAENARLLMSSRFVNADVDATDDDPPAVELSLQRVSGGGVAARVSLKDEAELKAALFYDRTAGTRSSVIAGRALNGREMTFVQSFPGYAPKTGEAEIEMFVTDGGGNVTRRTASLSLSPSR